MYVYNTIFEYYLMFIERNSRAVLSVFVKFNENLIFNILNRSKYD